MRWVSWVLAPALALALGAATLTGRFVGGDDHRLVLEHVLVSRPSLAHALELFRIEHRDLYQPLPLLTFSLEFALCKAVGLRADLPWPDGGAWVFHLTNVLLHALNAFLVSRLLLRWDGRVFVAIGGACLFAVHPLQVEVVAWINGRMMLLSTLFALAGLIAADACLRRVSESNGHDDDPDRSLILANRGAQSGLRRVLLHPALWMVVCAVLSFISKVRVGLPLMMLLPAAIHRHWSRGCKEAVLCDGDKPLPDGRGSEAHAKQSHGSESRATRDGSESRPTYSFWIGWVLVALLAAVFAAVNIHATAENEMFEHAAEQMGGSRLARCILALGWYLRHFVWPTGLAAWYEAPKAVLLTDPATLMAAGIVALAAVGMVVSLRHTRLGLFAAAFFLLGIGDTLPLVPARNLLAADRYMYLPIIALVWMAAGLWHSRVVRSGFTKSPISDSSAGTAGPSPGAKRRLSYSQSLCAIVIPIVVLGSLLESSWRLAPTYESAIAKTQRIIDVHPNSPWVHERLGWAYYNADDFENAIAAGRDEYARHRDVSGCEAMILIGASQLAAGRSSDAVASLRQALVEKPGDAMAMYRLALALAQSGVDDEALDFFRKAVAELRLFNPGLTKAADFMRSKGLTDEARALYEQVLRNNPYDMNAAFELAKMDMANGKVIEASDRLEQVLSWAPDFTAARTNLGVCFEAQGRVKDAHDAYAQAAAHDPSAVQAMLNLARMEEGAGRANEAERLFARALEASAWHDDVVEAASTYHLRNGRPGESANLWRRCDARAPLRADLLARFACTLAFAGHNDEGRGVARRITDEAARRAVETALDAIDAVRNGQTDRALSAIDALANAEIMNGAQASESALRNDAAAPATATRATLDTCATGFLSMLKRQPDQALLYYVYGVSEAGLGHAPLATAALEACIELTGSQEVKAHVQAALDRLKKPGPSSQGRK